MTRNLHWLCNFSQRSAQRSQNGRAASPPPDDLDARVAICAASGDFVPVTPSSTGNLGGVVETNLAAVRMNLDAVELNPGGPFKVDRAGLA